MAKEKKSNVNNTINMKFRPMQCQSHVEALKCVNDDWGTIAFSIPRNQIKAQFADEELRYNFIYFLFGYDDCKEVVYVGQAKKRNNGESILARLREHDDSTTEKYRDKWEWVIAVTNKDDAWGLDDLNALEYAFCKEIPVEQSLNGNNPNSGGANYNEYIDKINQIKSFITAFGFTMFSDEATTEEIQVLSEEATSTRVEDLQNGMARIPEIITPHKIVKAMVDMLPSDVWNSHTTFLDPACKGGEYLREVYDRLMDCESLQLEFPDRVVRSHHILKNQIFGIALSQVSLGRTTKKLFNEDKNIRVIPDYMCLLRTRFDPEMKAEDRRNYIMNKIKKEFGREDMHFDVVIGNPPYQEITDAGKNGGKVLYDKFIHLGLNICNRVCMIVKNNWMNSNELKDLRQRMINNGLETIVNYSLLGEIFPGNGIAASIIYVDKNHTGKIDYTEIQKNKIISKYCEDIKGIGIVPTSQIEYHIISKIKQIAKNYFDKHLYSQNTFGIATNGKITLGINKDRIQESVIDTEDYNVLLKYDKSESFVRKEDIPTGTDILLDYKIICPKQIHKTNNPIPRVLGLGPNQICTGSYTVMYTSKDKKEAFNVYNYIKTKFFRFLVWSLADTLCALTKYRVSMVPDQDFTSKSDVDWMQPISNIDQQLYKKYKLSGEEIEYIEKMIKPME